jgi:hypothetical protein
MNEEIKRIACVLRRQDNHGTADPMFAVRESVREYGFTSEYTDKYVWMDHVNECHIASGYLRRKLEAGKTSGKCSRYEKTYYKSKWKTVQVFFTEEAANSFVRDEAHNYGKMQVSAISLHRNREMRMIREYLLSLAD